MRDATYEEANARGAALRAEGHAVSARYDPATGQLLVKLSTGQMLTIPVRFLQGLSEAPPMNLRDIVVSPSGLGLYFPALDVDVSVPGLREEIYGTPNWMRRLHTAAGTVGLTGISVDPLEDNARRAPRSATPRPKRQNIR